MKRLAWWLIRAQFQTRRTATALSMLAIALGVALGYAIHLINDAALADFSQAMKSVQGEPDAVVAPQDSAGRVPLALINELAQDEGVALVVPVIETRVRIGELAVRLVGLGMGGWFLSTGIGNNLSGIFASVVSGETGMTTDSALSGYTFGFWALVGSGVLLFLIAPLIQRLMHGVK